ncbi:MAG: glucosaminidase domain-containing protein [Flavobacteriales bacterium]
MIHLISWFFIPSLLLDTEDKTSRAEYIQQWKNEAIFQMTEHKIPASITLAQGILESRDGQSRLAVEGNNHFGIKCHKDWQGERIYEDDETKGECFRKYESAKESYEDHSLFLKKNRYAPLFELDVSDYKGWAKGLKQCGYATNPDYPALLIKIIEENQLYEYDQEGLQCIKSGKKPDRKSNQTAITSENATSTSDKKSNYSTSKNKIRYVVAQKGDTPESIGRAQNINGHIIARYNDITFSGTFKAGEWVYLQPKKRSTWEKWHVIAPGENLRDISQRYGVKMRVLRRINKIEDKTLLVPGKKIKLKRDA